MSLDATPSGASANSYVTQSAASAYMANRLNTDAWDAASSAEKDAALIMATTRLDAENYQGYKATYTQALQWPRFSTFDRDGIVYSSSTIPPVVQQATFEYALALLQEPTLLGDTGLEGFANVRLGSLDITPRVMAATKLPALVMQLLTPVRLAGGGTPVRRA